MGEGLQDIFLPGPHTLCPSSYDWWQLSPLCFGAEHRRGEEEIVEELPPGRGASMVFWEWHHPNHIIFQNWMGDHFQLPHISEDETEAEGLACPRPPSELLIEERRWCIASLTELTTPSPYFHLQFSHYYMRQEASVYFTLWPRLSRELSESPNDFEMTFRYRFFLPCCHFIVRREWLRARVSDPSLPMTNCVPSSESLNLHPQFSHQ